jgi:hypothetical protein
MRNRILLAGAFALSLTLPVAAQLVTPSGTDTAVNTPDAVERLRIKSNGRIGVGVTNPTGVIELKNTAKIPHIMLTGAEYFDPPNGTSTDGIGIYLGTNRVNNRQLWFGDSASATSPRFRMMFYSSYASLDAISPDGLTARTLAVGVHGNVGLGTGTGNVGVGTLAPTSKFHVVGNAFVEGTLSGTNIQANYQDIAEWVPASSDLEPGTVVVLNADKNNEVRASSTPYDTMVAGVVSAQPGLTLGIAAKTKETVATTGRVKVRVDARNAPIKVGDLLVTSSVAGTAMKSEPMDINGRKFHQPGTIIGKALEPLAGGTGEILVLLSMQ